MSENTVMVEMTVKTQTGSSASGYPQWDTLAEFAVPANISTAFRVFQDSLAKVTAPTAMVSMVDPDQP